MNKQAIIDKIAQELKLFNKPVLQEALDYIEYLREKYFTDQLTEEELKEIKCSRKEIQEGRYVTLATMETWGVTIASESSLKKDWLTSEEDEAWRNL